MEMKISNYRKIPDFTKRKAGFSNIMRKAG